MFADNYWAHNSPQGKTPWTFFDAVGYKYSTAGENLDKEFYNTDSLVSAWMNSPTHKANIVNSKCKEIISPKSNDIVVPEVLSQTNVLSSQNEKLISPLTLSKIFSSIIFIVLIGVIFIDGFVT